MALDAFSRPSDSAHAATRGPVVLLIPGLGGTSAGGYVKTLGAPGMGHGRGPWQMHQADDIR